MKRIFLFLIALALFMGACDSNKVKVRGKVAGLEGTVKLLAEMPGQQGLVILAQQDVTDGNINLVTEQLQLPARVWVDIAGKNTLETIVDSKDQIWIQGKIKFPDQIEVKARDWMWSIINSKRCLRKNMKVRWNRSTVL